MTDEIASFKVTAADIQEQEKPPSGDGHMTPAAISAWLATHSQYGDADNLKSSLIPVQISELALMAVILDHMWPILLLGFRLKASCHSRSARHDMSHFP